MDSITTANDPRLHDISVDSGAWECSEIAKIPPVVLGDCAQNALVVRQIALGQSRVHATRTRDGNAQHHLIADGQRPACPGVLNVRFPLGSDDHIWPEPSDVKAPLWIRPLQVIDCGSRDQVHAGIVEESTWRSRAGERHFRSVNKFTA